MKAVILAAGYATRLYPLTRDVPKPLLEVAGKPMIEYIIDAIEGVSCVDEIYTVTNGVFYEKFACWLNGYTGTKKVTLINDGTKTNETRLGAVGDIVYTIEQQQIDDDLLVIAGDNLFGFSLDDFVEFFTRRKENVVALCDAHDIEVVRNKFGVAVLEGERVVGFEEKPAEPSSTMMATACYIYRREDLALVCRLAHEGNCDNSGEMILKLVENSNVSGYVFEEYWFDVGSLEGLAEARQLISSLEK